MPRRDFRRATRDNLHAMCNDGEEVVEGIKCEACEEGKFLDTSKTCVNCPEVLSRFDVTRNLQKMCARILDRWIRRRQILY